MSEAEPEAIEIPHRGDLAFGTLMDALAPGEGEEAQGDGATAPGAVGDSGADDARGDARGTAGGDAGADGSTDQAGRPGDEDSRATDEAERSTDGVPGGHADGTAEQRAAEPGRTDTPSTWTVEPAAVTAQLGGLSDAIEQNITKAYQAQAYQKVREEYGKYFEALEKHPRLLVGQEVPATQGEGMERLTSSEDAKEWQEAIKSILLQEINSRATTQVEANRNILETIHSSVKLFQDNADLIPGTRGFNRELADSFATMAKPYEVRSDGKLQGYSIPVQPIIDNLRAQLVARSPTRATTPPAAASSSPAEPPQAGIPSKAASGSEPEDFSTLFGTIGLPNLRI